MKIYLADLHDTEQFGQAFAKTLLWQMEETKKTPEKTDMLKTIYLLGEMGSGKTTFTRAFVNALPGAEHAEVASPSFTICHEYPTTPEIYHADLYRLPDGIDLPEELQDAYDERTSRRRKIVLLIEWAERLNSEFWAKDRLELTFQKTKSACDEKNNSENIDSCINLCERYVNVSAHGETARAFEKALQKTCRIAACRKKTNRLTRL